MTSQRFFADREFAVRGSRVRYSLFAIAIRTTKPEASACHALGVPAFAEGYGEVSP
jgi:hypothetical protein